MLDLAGELWLVFKICVLDPPAASVLDADAAALAELSAWIRDDSGARADATNPLAHDCHASVLNMVMPFSRCIEQRGSC